MEVRSPKLSCRQCGSCLLRLNRLCGEQGLLAGVLGRAECRAHLATALPLDLCVSHSGHPLQLCGPPQLWHYWPALWDWPGI